MCANLYLFSVYKKKDTLPKRATSRKNVCPRRLYLNENGMCSAVLRYTHSHVTPYVNVVSFSERYVRYGRYGDKVVTTFKRRALPTRAKMTTDSRDRGTWLTRRGTQTKKSYYISEHLQVSSIYFISMDGDQTYQRSGQSRCRYCSYHFATCVRSRMDNEPC